MSTFFDLDNQPEAGPSRWWRRNGGERKPIVDETRDGAAEVGDDVALIRGRQRLPVGRGARGAALKRQGQTTTTSTSSFSSSFSSTTSTSPPIFVGPTITTSSSTVSSSNAVSKSTSSSASVRTSTAPETELSSTSTTSSSPTRTFSSLWSATRFSTPSATPTYVAGTTFSLSLGGSRDDEAVYAVEVEFGHGDDQRKRRRGLSSNVHSSAAGLGNAGGDFEGRDREGLPEAKRTSGKRAPEVQKLRLQVDLGSSDMWVATTNCATSDCRSAPARFDASESISSYTPANMTYHSGSVGGIIMWEEIQMAKFAIAYQAFIAGDRVSNENLGGAGFSGVLGMALPANSVISSLIPGTTSSNPDGATFLDNLFGSGSLAPSSRIFSLSLERREDTRTSSFLTIGSVSDKYCPAPCNPSYIPIINHPNLGTIGYLHWRIPLQGIIATTWSDQQKGTGASNVNITLGPSLVVSSRSQPLAVLDSGGVAMLVGSKSYADAIYGAYGISASADGYCASFITFHLPFIQLDRMPCKTQLALTFVFGSQSYPAHPLDMSWPDPSDPSQTTCIGAIQYTPNLGSSGDFVMGSAFLKNVYSIFSYPDQAGRAVWQPGVALRSLTSASVASQDFYAVRYLRQSLSSVSSNNPDNTGTSPTNPSSPVTSNSSSGGSVVNTTAIVAGSVVGFFVLAAFIFSAWWFFLKRKYSKGGLPGQPRDDTAGGGRGHNSELSTSTVRSKKHQEILRQKSMIEGYSDYEDSWTEAGDSIRLGFLPHTPVEERDGEDMRGRAEGSRGSSLRRGDGVTDIVVPQVQSSPLSRGTIAYSHADYASHGDHVGEGNQDGFGSAVNDGTVRSPFGDGQGTEASSNIERNTVHGQRDSSIPRSVTFQPDTQISPPTSPSAPLIMPYTLPGQSSPQAYTHGPLPSYTSPMHTERSSSRSRDPTLNRDRSVPRSLSFSMSGPFPTPLNRSSHTSADIGGQLSPMYDIRSSDYFDTVDVAGGSAMEGNHRGRRRGSQFGLDGSLGQQGAPDIVEEGRRGSAGSARSTARN